jgi:arsenate reductase
MKIHSLKSCDTCKKAIKALTAAGHNPEVIDVRNDGIDAAALNGWLTEAGVDVVVNKRSTTWRGLADDQRAEAETSTGAATLILANPTLLKRPVIEADGSLYIGWTKEAQSALL